MRNSSRFCLAALALLPGLAGIAAAASSEIKIGADRRIGINRDWRFFKGEAAGAEQAAFDETGWRPLHLPHDWAIEGPFDPQDQPAHRRTARSSDVAGTASVSRCRRSAKDRYFSVEFDGAMSNAHVWLNGQELGGRPYGYIGFAFDLTPPLKFGEDERAGGATGARGAVVALVSGRGDLSQRVARRHRPGARGALGHVRDHAVGDRCQRDGRGAHGSCAIAARTKRGPRWRPRFWTRRASRSRPRQRRRHHPRGRHADRAGRRRRGRAAPLGPRHAVPVHALSPGESTAAPYSTAT